MRIKNLIAGAALAALTLGLAALPAAAQAPAFLKGAVKAAGSPTAALTARLDEARTQAKGADYFTAFQFESRHRIHSRGDGRIVESYDVQTKGTRISVRSKSEKDSEGLSTDDSGKNPSPAILLMLWSGAKSGPLLDASVLDPAQTYTFTGTPVFWLGTASNDDSLGLLESMFPRVEGEHLKTTMLFLASCHTGPRGYAFLKKTALGSEAVKVRESAVFWLGQSGEPRVLADLQEILGREKSTDLRKSVVFAISQMKSQEATAELIALAKNDSDQEIRKNAIFWLGQKASAESVKALKDIVEAKDGESGLKDQAVFALSQLPKDRSVPMLIDIARTNASPAVRKKAIFWLGQSGDEKALKFFEEILLKK
jgi:hypothetical protein